jgi:hypothetical protein
MQSGKNLMIVRMAHIDFLLDDEFSSTCLTGSSNKFI